MSGPCITTSRTIVFSLNILLVFFEHVVHCQIIIPNVTTKGTPQKSEKLANTILPIKAPQSVSQIVVKEVIENDKPLIATSPDDFINFARHSDVFVDKTRFIGYLLNNYNESIILITCPSGMGKTLNLNAVADFLSVEVDENGERIPLERSSNYILFAKGEVQSKDLKSAKKLNQPLLISKDKNLIANFLGKYPVIRLNLRELRGSGFKNILRGFKIALSEAFEDHKYVLKIFNKTMAKQKYNLDTEMLRSFFVNILEREENDENKLIQAISFLSKILYTHFKNFVYLFVDEYDVGFNEMFLNPKVSKDHRNKFLKFFKTFVHTSTKNNPYLASAYFTGVVEIDDDTLRLSMYDCRGEEFYQYYGISKEEITGLFDATNIPINQRTEVAQWYNGYRFGKNKDVKVFHPQSIAHFISCRKFDSYWTDSSAVDNFLKIALKNPSFRDVISDLVYNNSVALVLTPNDLKFYEEHYDRFREFVGKIVKSSSSYVPRLVLQYLYVSGYLEIQDTGLSFSSAYSLKFPNTEITIAVARKIESFYDEALELRGNHSSTYSVLQKEFAAFLFDNNINSPKLEQVFENYLKALPKFVKKITADTDFDDESLENELALRFLIGFLTFKLKYNAEGSGVVIKRINSIHRSDLIIFSNNKIALVELNLKIGQIEQELAKPQKYVTHFGEKITAIKYVSITTNKDKKVRLEAVVKTL